MSLVDFDPEAFGLRATRSGQLLGPVGQQYAREQRKVTTLPTQGTHQRRRIVKVRRWEKKWVPIQDVPFFKWVRVEGTGTDAADEKNSNKGVSSRSGVAGEVTDLTKLEADEATDHAESGDAAQSQSDDKKRALFKMSSNKLFTEGDDGDEDEDAGSSGGVHESPSKRAKPHEEEEEEEDEDGDNAAHIPEEEEDEEIEEGDYEEED